MSFFFCKIEDIDCAGYGREEVCKECEHYRKIPFPHELFTREKEASEEK